MDDKTRAKRILDILEKEFPDPKPALAFKTPLELLVATILSVQCTDERVNKTTAVLFKKYKKASDYANADCASLEAALKNINFYRNKTASIMKSAKIIAERHAGKVPDTLEELTALPGVGRKTANIVLGNAFGIPSLAVDTHVKRVSTRLGLARADDPDEIEAELCAIIPKKRWTLATHYFIFHGRKTCKARGPLCNECKVSAYCDYFKAL
jgi:endonuclease-3